MASATVPRFNGYGSDQDLERILARPILGRRLDIVVIGAHPDDPETGCGGTIAKLTGDGHHVTIVYFTRGEAGVRNGDHSETARVRTGEALAAAKTLGADAVFANQIDGRTAAGEAESAQFTELLLSLDPHLVMTHWPHDTHADHRNAAKLTRAAWEAGRRAFTLVYYEVMTGIQTYDFRPNLYVDVSSTEEQKQAAIYAHVCQKPDRFYPYHVNMERQRGTEAKLSRAEAFVVMRQNAGAQVIPFPAEKKLFAVKQAGAQPTRQGTGTSSRRGYSGV
jgi:N-acetylglucosamine malate deacetylase 1